VNGKLYKGLGREKISYKGWAGEDLNMKGADFP
jgi:hypothetical protein